MQHPAPTVTGADAALFERVLSLALGETHRLLERALESTRHALQKLEDLARTPGERHGLIESRQQLVRLSALMAERYPGALRQAIAQDALDQSKTTRSLFSVHFDELELMDEHQIHASVERARVREVLAEATDAALAEFDALVSAALGLASVQPGRNPLRPDVFLQALQTVLGQMQVSEAVRRDWMTPMAQALGAELRDFYGRLTAQLRQAGIKPIGYAIRQADGRHACVAVDAAQGHTPGFAAAAPHENTVAAVPRPGRPGAPPPAAHPQQEALLTLERLRRLLQGELDPGQAPGRMERFAQQFSDTFDGLHDAAQAESPPDFDVTVPAAFEALQEMKQVDRLVERLGRQRAAGQAQEPAAARLGQALGQEVVALMVDNLAQDQRLLPPVQDVVRQLEPALLRLAVDDPRFFSDPSTRRAACCRRSPTAAWASRTCRHRASRAFCSPCTSAPNPWPRRTRPGARRASKPCCTTCTSAGPRASRRASASVHAPWSRCGVPSSATCWPRASHGRSSTCRSSGACRPRSAPFWWGPGPRCWRRRG